MFEFNWICWGFILLIWRVGELGANQSPRVVFTKQGPVQGIVGPAPVSQSQFPYSGSYATAGTRPMVEIFLGIPYATPSRYESPAPLAQRSRTDVYAANVSRAGCPRTAEDALNRTGNIRSTFLALKKTMTMDDCLYLDIYAPLNSDKSRFNQGLPVLVFSNSDLIDNFDGSSMAAIGNIIVISFRYRTGVLGFLQTGFTAFSRSNFGLWDQLAALQWIKENIMEFGGDQNKITLMGYDIDANLIGLLASSPVSQAYGGLFHRLIMINGSPFSPTSINQRPFETTFHLARTLNCPLFERAEGDLANCFRRTPIPQILKAAEAIGSQLLTYPFAPIFDGTLLRGSQNEGNHSPLISSQISHENLGKYDVLMGLKSGNVLPIVGRPAIKPITIDRLLTAVIKLGLNTDIEPSQEIKEAVLKHLVAEYGTSPPIRELLSDYLLVSPTTEFLNAHRKNAYGRSTFFYVSKDYDPLKIGRKHNELAYIFSNELYNWKYSREAIMRHPYQTLPVQADLSPFELLVNLLANFVRSGDPNIFDTIDRTQPAAKPWPHYTPEFGRYLELGKEIDFPALYASVPTHFWSETLPAILKPLMNSSSSGGFPPIFNTSGRNRNLADIYKPDDENTLIASTLYPIGPSSLLIIGLALLTLNTLCFLGLYYQRLKLKKVELMLRKRYFEAELAEESRKGTEEEEEGYEAASFYQKPEGGGGGGPRFASPPAKIASSESIETDNGFGPDFLTPNYDPRTKVTRWMRNSRDCTGDVVKLSRPPCPLHNVHNHPSFLLEPEDPEGNYYHHTPTNQHNTHPVHNSILKNGHGHLLNHISPYYVQPFKPTQTQREMDEMSSSIPFADASYRTSSPSTITHGLAMIPPSQNSTLNSHTAHQVLQPNNQNPIQNLPSSGSRASVLIVRDLEDQEGSNEGETKLVPVKTGTLTRSVGVGQS